MAEPKIALESIISGSTIVALGGGLLWWFIKREFHRFEEQLETLDKRNEALKESLYKLEGEFSHVKRDASDASRGFIIIEEVKSVTIGLKTDNDILKRNQETAFLKIDKLNDRTSKIAGHVQLLIGRAEKEEDEEEES